MCIRDRSATGPSAAAVVADAAVQWRKGQSTGSRCRDDRVKAPPAPVDLDDVARLNALEPHARLTPARIHRPSAPPRRPCMACDVRTRRLESCDGSWTG